MKFHLYPLFAIGITLLVFSSCQQNARHDSIDDRKISFNENWLFRLEDSLKTDIQWRTLNVPHDWSIEGDFDENSPAGVGGGALPGGTGWYKKDFKVPAEDSSKITHIRFDGIYRNSEVWINNQLLGKRPNGYIGFEYDLTPYLHYNDSLNEIKVKVDNSQQPNSRWYSGSGIYRNVWLIKTDKLHIAPWGTFVTTPAVSSDSASVNIEVNVINDYSEKKEITLKTTLLFDDQNIAEDSQKITLNGVKNGVFQQKIDIKNPKLWSIENPQMYDLVSEIYSDDKLVDSYKTPLGIRTFKFDTEKGFLLNGKHVKIKGVCNHYDLGPLGTAINTRALERQLKILKEMGVNGIRTAHNPPAPELLDLCDKMGFIVMDEAFDMWKKGKNKYDYSLDWDKWHKKDLEDFIKRDRNHPSVFIWSIGNEILEQWDSTGVAITKELAGIVHQLDTTRPVTTANNPPSPTNSLNKAGVLDLVGYNYAHEKYEDHINVFPNTPFIATETTSALETRGYYDQKSDTIKRWPVSWDKLFTGGNPGNTVSAYDQVSAPWGSTHEETWKVIKKHDYLSGMFIWTGFDYLGEPTPYVWPSRSSYFGEIDLAGFPKDVYYMYKSEWTDEPVLHIFPHWNWTKGDNVDIWAYYSQADEVELFLNGKSLGTKHKEGDDLHVMWRVPFEPGTLKAVSRKNGKEVLTQEIKTADKAQQIVLTADNQQIKADGIDLSFITVLVQDKNGTLVPNATNNITFKVEGPGKIVGVASGDPTSHESFKASERKVFHGKCIVIIQAEKEQGTITLTGQSPDLKENSIQIKTN
ncbi:MAG: beta-galactosidase GalB [Leeuwenhoekiella sp.]